MRLFAWVLSYEVPRQTRSTANQLLYLIDGAKIEGVEGVWRPPHSKKTKKI